MALDGYCDAWRIAGGSRIFSIATIGWLHLLDQRCMRASLGPQISNESARALRGTNVYVIMCPLNASRTEEDIHGILSNPLPRILILERG